MKIGFIGLGNLGSNLAGSLLNNGIELYINDIDNNIKNSFEKKGAKIINSNKELAYISDIIITCLPSPKISSQVLESKDGIIEGISENKIWLEMSTTDASEVIRLSKILKEKKALTLDAPVSGGCHRAATGNISIFVGGDRSGFEKVLPILKIIGKDIIHTGELGSASILKVITNYLASTHLVALGEALTVAKMYNISLNKTYEAIKSSSGNSFVHETESQVILNGSYNINFTMDLVLKDIKLFNNLSINKNIPLEISPLLLNIFNDGIKKYGSQAWSSMIVKRLEDNCNISLREKGYPSILIDKESKITGKEI